VSLAPGRRDDDRERRMTAGSALGKIIRRQRELSEMSMRQFATVAGISNPYLSQIERGLRAPSERVLEGIAEALETSWTRSTTRRGSTVTPSRRPSPTSSSPSGPIHG
jgi:transcriptional regulator with XRE-family HTH domain